MGLGHFSFWHLSLFRSGTTPKTSEDSVHSKCLSCENFPRGSPVYHAENIINHKVPTNQAVLLLRKPKSQYILSSTHDIPELQGEQELLIRIRTIGLNPIDWKAPDYGFGIPALPHISGRDFAGVVVKAPKGQSRIKAGDVVVSVSTDYRDLRKAAYQEYAVANDYNVCRIPQQLDINVWASVGVAFVAAALALGVCLGVDFSLIGGLAQGPDLLSLVRSLSLEDLPRDISNECLEGIERNESPQAGDWIAIWGGSTTTALFLSQLSLLFGARVIMVVDIAKHGARLSRPAANSLSTPLLIDRHDSDRAVSIIRQVTGGNLKYAIDTTGRDSATKLLEAMSGSSQPIQPSTTEGPAGVIRSQAPAMPATTQSHLVGLSGLPKEPHPSTLYHNVPIKLFHEIQTIGEALALWMERLLSEGLLSPPEVTVVEGGLGGINEALDMMRRGEVSGRRLVVPI